MKDCVFTCAIVVIVALLAFLVCGCQESVKYDAADPIYKFIPLADKSWTDKFGDTDDTRMKHSMSELRVVVAAQGNLINAHEERLHVLETTIDFNDFDVRFFPTVVDPSTEVTK